MNVLLILNTLIFWSIRAMWSGIIAIVGKPIPYILMVVLAITTLVATLCSMNKKQPLSLTILGCVLDVLFLGLNGYMLAVTQDSWAYFIREFFYGAAFLGATALLIFLIFYAAFPVHPVKSWIHGCQRRIH